MFRKIRIIAPWGLLAFIAYASLSPQDRPTLSISLNFVSFEHLAAFATLGAMFYLAYPRQFALVCLTVVGSAILLELMQLLTPDRHARAQDALEKMLGGAAGISGWSRNSSGSNQDLVSEEIKGRRSEC